MCGNNMASNNRRRRIARAGKPTPRALWAVFRAA
jgi:hypothetical protein